MSSITTRIQNILDALSPAEQRVGDWILANLSGAADASLADVAGATRVSEPTVIRFCRSLGLSGFRELKTCLISARQRPESYLHHDVHLKDTTMSAATKVIDSSLRALVDVRERFASMPFDTAVDTLAKARQVVFAGMGASGMVAHDVRHKFFRLGLPCSTASDPQTILQQASIVTPEDVIVAISHTGQWPEMIKAVRLASGRGATVIALTDPDAKLAQASSIVFACYPHEDTNVFTPMTSRLTHLVILDALQVALALQMGEAAQENLRVTKETLVSFRSQKILEID